MTHPLLADLSEPQARAVITSEGPLLVLAAAGSGKTRVITRRIAWLVKEIGIPPWNVLAITFTNKAAGEMRQRCTTILTERQTRAITVSTFHSLCARLLREYGPLAGVPGDFLIYDSDDQKRCYKEVYARLDIAKEHIPIEAARSRISNAKNELRTAADYARAAGDFVDRKVAEIYKAYEMQMKAAKALDFDDLLLRTAAMLRDHAEVRSALQERFQYILIDEYQDTNHAQFMIAHTLAAAHQNICVVGDPDQSIYGWRGADLRNILDFEEHYRTARVIELGQNYRSTPQILKAADTLIRNNKRRKHKALFTDRTEGEAIQLVKCADEEDEAERVCDWLKSRHDAGLAWSEMAIFYRINALSRTLEQALRQRTIPYQIARGTAFYDRKEVRDALAYLRVLVHPEDEIALKRIINFPTRGIGKTSIDHVQAYAISRGISMWEAMQRPGEIGALTSRAQNALKRFVGLFHEWQKAFFDLDRLAVGWVPGVREVMETIIKQSGLEKHYENDDEEKLANLYELITDTAKFDEIEVDENDAVERARADLPPVVRGILRYLDQASLTADVDSVEAGSGAVTLMTLHAAKGLEFPAVAMVGLEEGLLPHSRAQDDPGELEEERRLCFVGITRAMRQLMLTHARYRTVRGMRDRTIESQFISELPEEVLEVRDESGWDDPFASSGFSRYGAYGAGGSRSDFRRSNDGAASAEAAGLPLGSLVRHPQFGMGRIQSIQGVGSNARARVTFQNVGTKTLVLEYARLTLVDEDDF